jgi:hypothetical protein
MRKVISFSLFGSNPLYLDGAVLNAERAPIVYPGWSLLFFVGRDVPALTVQRLESLSALVEPVDDSQLSERERLIQGMYWRFYVLDRADVSHALFRDCDSRLGTREASAVEARLDSGADFHFMYDHKFHSVPVLGGMWGCRGGVLSHIRETVAAYHSRFISTDAYWPRCDQSFLREFVWSRCEAGASYLAHGDGENCAYHLQAGINLRPFPACRVDPVLPEPQFVGQVVQVPGAGSKLSKV